MYIYTSTDAHVYIYRVNPINLPIPVYMFCVVCPGMEAISEGKEPYDSRDSTGTSSSNKPERAASRFGSESRANEAAVFMQVQGWLVYYDVSHEGFIAGS